LFSEKEKEAEKEKRSIRNRKEADIKNSSDVTMQNSHFIGTALNGQDESERRQGERERKLEKKLLGKEDSREVCRTSETGRKNRGGKEHPPRRDK